MKKTQKTLKQRLSSWAAMSAVVGVALSPAMVGAAPISEISGTYDDEGTTINGTVQPVIKVTTLGERNFELLPDGDGNVSTVSDTVGVSTNDSNGYTLTIVDTDGDPTLVNASGPDTFAQHAGTKASPTALANNTWGYALNSGAGGGTSLNFDSSYSSVTSANSSLKFAGVPAVGSPDTIKTTSDNTSHTNGTFGDGVDTVTVWYGAKANLAQPTGVYTGAVTYTATVN